MSELPPDTPERGIEFRYIRSNEFRTYHTDGVMGHWTPRGKLYLEGFTERAALPDAILHRVDEEEHALK